MNYREIPKTRAVSYMPGRSLVGVGITGGGSTFHNTEAGLLFSEMNIS